MLYSRQDRRRILACCTARHQMPDADVPFGVLVPLSELIAISEELGEVLTQ